MIRKIALDLKNHLKTHLEERLCLIFLLINLIVALASRLPFLRCEGMWADEALYGWLAQRISHDPSLIFSKEIIQFQPPLFPLLLAAGGALFPCGSTDLAYRSVALLIGLAGIVLVYVLGSKIKDRFLGIFCALVLSYNYYYWVLSSYILADGLLTVLFILLALTLINTKANSPFRADSYVGLTGAAIILLKWSGIIVIPLIGIYYILALKELDWRHRIRRMLIPFLWIGLVQLCLAINNYHQLGNLFPYIGGLSSRDPALTEPFWFYAGHLENLISVPMVLFLFYGLYAILREGYPVKILLLGWFIIFFTTISFVAEKDFRYCLPVIPAIILIAGIGLMWLMQRFLGRRPVLLPLFKIAIIILFCWLSWKTYPSAKFASLQHDRTYNGFAEAGRWITTNTSLDYLILSGSERNIRYATGINYQEFKGSIMPLPIKREDFEDFVRQATKPLLLEIDYWNYRQPSWAFPITEETGKYLSTLGFRLVEIIHKDVLVHARLERDIPVIYLFEHP